MTPPLFLAWFLLVIAPSTSRAVTLISLSFNPNVSTQQQQIFNDAATFLNNTITGYDLIYDGVGAVVPHSLNITVSIPLIDGVGGILGSAGPNQAMYYDNNPFGAPSYALYYTTAGSMQFDSADVSGLIANNSFFGVVLHEMTHVLGIGTLWTINNNVNGTTYQLYNNGSGLYTGPNALNGWKTEFNQPTATAVPVELGGGSGTANGHWNEVDFGAGNTGFVSYIAGLDFRQELMTGWASTTFFLSTVTLGGLDDLGYTVDYSKAGVINYVPVPEPGTFGMALLALGTLLANRRRRL